MSSTAIKVVKGYTDKPSKENNRNTNDNLRKRSEIVNKELSEKTDSTKSSKTGESFFSTLEDEENEDDDFIDIDYDDLINKIDEFLERVENRLDRLEKFGLHKLSEIDQSIASAYDTFDQIRKSLSSQAGDVFLNGASKAEYLTKIIEKTYSTANNSKDESLAFLETKFGDFELKCVEIMNEASSTLEIQSDLLNLHVRRAIESSRLGLLSYDQLPAPWKENPFILNGYRFCASYSDCITSVVRFHNETCNIWSHFLGFIAMIFVAFYFFPSSSTFLGASRMDKLVSFVFLAAACKCLAFSTIWHTFCNIAHVETKQRFACFDYTGISVLIAASIITTQYFSFYCQPIAQATSIFFTSLLGLVGSLLAWSPSFDTPENRPVRIVFFVGLALLGLLGPIYQAFLRGFFETWDFYLPVLKSLLAYGSGVAFYGLLIPERFFPGTVFDWIGASHNVWHIAVFAGIYYHYLAIHYQLEHATEFSCSVPN